MINQMMEKHKISPDDEVFINIDDVHMDNELAGGAPERNGAPANTHYSTTISELGKKLLLAAQEGDPEEIRELLSSGAPLSADWLGTSPLHLAAQNNHLEACELFLAAGLCKDTRTKVDRTPLHMAATEGLLDIVECLLKHAADPDARDMLYMTPLHWAVQNGHAEVASMLIRNGATTTAISKFKLTPLDIALQINRSDIVQIINYTTRDPQKATEQLVALNKERRETSPPALQLRDAERSSKGRERTAIPIEAVLLDQNGRITAQIHDPDHIYEQQVDADEQDQAASENSEEMIAEETEQHSFTESIKYLQQHGITILPDDESNILNTVMEAGHSVVLTEAGKQVLDSFKAEKRQASAAIVHSTPRPKSRLQPSVKKKIITVTAEQFLAMAANGGSTVRVVNGKLVQGKNPPVRRFVMKKNKVQPIQQGIRTVPTSSEPPVPPLAQDALLAQLQKAHALILTYKQRLAKTELELQKCRRKCSMLMDQCARNIIQIDM